MEQLNLNRPENEKTNEVLTGFFKRVGNLDILLAEACRLGKEKYDTNH